MSKPVDNFQVSLVLSTLAEWVAENATALADELLIPDQPGQNTVVAGPLPDHHPRGCIILGLWTSRTALRKFLRYFSESPKWTDAEKTSYLTVAMTELQDAINNCNIGLYHLAVPDSAGIHEVKFSFDEPKGGDQ